MENNGRKVALVVGAIAAAAGVAVASYLVFGARRGRNSNRFQNVADLLTDCYTRIKEMQRTLGELHPSALEPTQG